MSAPFEQEAAGEVSFAVENGLGLMTLDRPKALNALSWAMTRDLGRMLAHWRSDDHVDAVLIRAAGGKAFCAGGDAVAATTLAKEGGADAAIGFFRDEYRLNWRIATFPKPFLALIDGVVMGGGVGISTHGARRVVTENLLYAMPETLIGFFPDVGGSYALPRHRGETGMWLGLTGARLGAADALVVGFATHGIASSERDALLDALMRRERSGGLDAIDATLRDFAATPPVGALDDARLASIDRCFGASDLEAALEALDAEDDAFAREQARILREERSPFALKIAFRQLREGRAMTIDQALHMEFGLAWTCLDHGDFEEGVRALLVDKDKRPRWRDASIEAVDAALVARAFERRSDLDLHWRAQ